MKFEFNEKSHVYKIDGKSISGTTTILGMISKPALVPWAAKQVVEYIEKNCEAVEKLHALHYQVSPMDLANAKTAYNKTRDDAASVGTDVHKEIEGYIRMHMQFQEFEKAITFIENPSKQAQHFIDWSRKNKTKFIASELVVFDGDLRVGGTCDILSLTDGTFFFDDIKTSSGIYDNTPFAQVNGAYRHMIYWMLEHLDDDIEIDVPNGKWKTIREYFEAEAPSLLRLDKFPRFGSRIINLKKTGKFNEEKDIHYSYDYPRDISIFKAALTLHRNVPKKK